MKFNAELFDPGPFAGADATVTHRYIRADGLPGLYVYDQRLVLAVNVALAARRPLPLAGEPGSGKTSLARSIAAWLGWRCHATTITSRSQSTDLLWQYDALARLNDANTRDGQALKEERHYVRPGPLWWALAPESAAWRGLPAGQPGQAALPDPGELAQSPPGAPNPGAPGAGAVLLVDELDKAEPELPNDLLEVVDARRFTLFDRGIEATRTELMMIFATNGERDFPGAFQRRCVVYRFPDERPAAWYVQIGERWREVRERQGQPVVDGAAMQLVAERLLACRKGARDAGQRPPGTAEYLDALNAMARLGVSAPASEAAMDEAWRQLELLVFRKPGLVNP